MRWQQHVASKPNQANDIANEALTMNAYCRQFDTPAKSVFNVQYNEKFITISI